MAESNSGQRRMGGRPVFIMNDDAERTQGRDAQSSNIDAGKAVSEAVRTTLGPRGMDKMLVSDTGDVTITNDGATILDTMDIEHPAAQMMVEVAEAQEEEVGDGTTTAAVLAGELLGEAEDLLDDDVHPTTIVEGYAEAREIALEAVEDLVRDADLDDDLLRQVAESSMTGKGTGDVTADRLAELVVRAIRHVEGDGVAGDGVARDDVRVHTEVGGSSSATELVEGVVSDAEPVHANMPATVEDATVAVVDEEFGVRETEIDAEYSVESVDQLTAAMDAEEQELRQYADALAEAGVDAVFSTDSIDDRPAGFLADEGILAFEDVDDDEARAVASATGATLVGTVEDVEESDLGEAESVSARTFGDEELAFVEGGAAAEAVTVLIRGGTEHVADELERALSDALDVVTAALESGGVVPGGGATEIVVADRVREAAAGVEGRKQLAVEAFADAVDVLPRTLAENVGMDPIDGLVDLRAGNEEAEGRAAIVATGQHGEIGDPVEEGILDPAAVKREAVESATEAATMIARIDDVISAE